MNAEKAIKKGARNILAKDSNMVKLIFAFGFLLIALYLLPSYLGYFSEIIPSAGKSEVMKNIATPNIGTLIYFCINVLVVTLMVLISPLFTGIKRITACNANGENTKLNEILYYFSSKKRYALALNINLSVIIKYIELAIICFLPAIICSALCMLLNGNAGDIEVLSLNVITVLMVICAIPLFIFLTRRYFMAEYIFVMKDYNKNVDITPAQCMKLSVKIMSENNNTTKAFKLMISFLPWFLLCFFIVPALYVVPYYFQSTALSQKFIYSIFKESSDFVGGFNMCDRT